MVIEILLLGAALLFFASNKNKGQLITGLNLDIKKLGQQNVRKKQKIEDLKIELNQSRKGFSNLFKRNTSSNIGNIALAQCSLFCPVGTIGPSPGDCSCKKTGFTSDDIARSF